MGIGHLMLGVTLHWTSISSIGSRITPCPALDAIETDTETG